jgi:hypothetical protein
MHDQTQPELTSGSTPQRSGRRSKRVPFWMLAAAFFLLAGFLLPPWINVSRFQRRIAASISRSLGRPVTLGQVSLRLLPAPGFELDNFVVGEDPGFGAEPVIRADAVTATLHISSLWHGRLEFSTISLDQPSVNLVRNAQGDWNIESILLQAARTPTAPTAQRSSSSVPRFPYIEASNARVNFKFGYEKTPFSLTGAEFALWQENAHQWGVRLKAAPTRTDMDLNDAGTLKVEGTLQRAAGLGDVPLSLRAEWYEAQLGGVSRLLLGQDIGWRGGLDMTAQIEGPANNLQIATRTQLDAVRRAEFMPVESLDLDARCTAHGADHLHTLDHIHCSLPLGDGELALAGEVTGLRRAAQPSLQLLLNKIPAQQLMVLVHHTSNEISPTLAATGVLNGKFTYGQATAGAPLQWQGQAALPTLVVTAPELAMPLSMKNLVLQTPQVGAPEARRGKTAKGKEKPAAAAVQRPTALTLEPVALSLGAAPPATLSGYFDTNGYAFHLQGEAAVKHLLMLDHALHFFGASMQRMEPSGTADLNMLLHGPWLRPLSTEDTSPVSTMEGSVALRNAELRYPLLHGPVLLEQASVRLTPQSIAWNNIAGTYDGIPLQGSLTIPARCTGGLPCGIQFSLTTPALDAAHLQAAVTGAGQKKDLLQDLLAFGHRDATGWPLLHGVLRANVFTLGTLSVQNATARILLDGKTATLENLAGKTLGGTVQASGTVSLSASQPAYAVDFALQQVRVSQAATLFREKWGAGTANVRCSLKLQGARRSALLASAQGQCGWDWRDGALAATARRASSTNPLAAFHGWQGEAQIAEQKIQLRKSVLDGGRIVSGSIGFDRTLQLLLQDGGVTQKMEGTLQQPRLAAAAPGTSSGK